MSKRSYVQLGFAKIDIQRNKRCGFYEIIYAPGKTREQLKKICDFFFRSKKPLVLTRLERQDYQELKKTFPRLNYSHLARIAFFLPSKLKTNKKISRHHVLIVSAGTSDMPVAEEASVMLEVLGISTRSLYDVGVAGLQRVLANKAKLRRAACIIVVAGMDAALASVVGGMVRCPVIAVPTSCGYGAHFEGLASLLAMLNSCAAGVGVVNIDNGFGAGILASKILGNFNGK